MMALGKAGGFIVLRYFVLGACAFLLVACATTHSINDISAAMLSGGFARAYDGGRRGSWCRS